MSPHVDGRGTVLRALPGSERMVGGPHMCMYHEIGNFPFEPRRVAVQ